MPQFKEVYIDDLPYDAKKELCDKLNTEKQFEPIALAMGYSQPELRQLNTQHCGSIDKLLDEWAQYNHTVTELYIVLCNTKNYKFRHIIKNFVDPKELIADPPQQKSGRSTENNENISYRPPKFPVAINQTLNNRVTGAPTHPTFHAQSSKLMNNASPSFPIPNIPYGELQAATAGWSRQLGRGGFGTVFAGEWQAIRVAVKRIEPRAAAAASRAAADVAQLLNELKALCRLRHDNILSVYAFSFGGPHPCLVYQYMAGESLASRLRKTGFLQWSRRLQVAKDTAAGLNYLHTVTNPPTVHCDIKSDNILLDASDVAKIGDFGLAREGPNQQVEYIILPRGQGTRPYLPIEFIRDRKFSTKVDSYSFGVVMFELATGLAVSSSGRGHAYLKDHVMQFEGEVKELMDDKFGLVDGVGIFMGLINLGKMCVEDNPRTRPEMDEVLKCLKVI